MALDEDAGRSFRRCPDVAHPDVLDRSHRATPYPLGIFHIDRDPGGLAVSDAIQAGFRHPCSRRQCDVPHRRDAEVVIDAHPHGGSVSHDAAEHDALPDLVIRRSSRYKPSSRRGMRAAATASGGSE